LARSSKATALLKFDRKLFKILIYYLFFTSLNIKGFVFVDVFTSAINEKEIWYSKTRRI